LNLLFDACDGLISDFLDQDQQALPVIQIADQRLELLSLLNAARNVFRLVALVRLILVYLAIIRRQVVHLMILSINGSINGLNFLLGHDDLLVEPLV
jgi:fatty acid desaturase